MTGPNFALYYAGDAYTTAGKIMGRQSAGKALMKGVARRWPDGQVHGFGPRRASGQAMLKQLQGDGFSGVLRWRSPPGDAVLDELGAVYYPAPVLAEMAHVRNSRSPTSYSLFGVTHTLSSEAAMDALAGYALAPYQAWDGLICTSTVALSVAQRLQGEMWDWQSEHLGATRFNQPTMKVIPLGVDAPAFQRRPDEIARARGRFDLAPDEVVFLFAGRLVFHGKANPAGVYLALEAASKAATHRLVCIEAGVYANAAMADAYRRARAELAPSIRFIEVDGSVKADFDDAWLAADVFTSLSDNIQETFGLTPVEAMAAGLPVLVSDWNGYKDTVREGVDGFRVPVVMPAPGSPGGLDLAMRHAMTNDTYDYFIGRVSMTTVVDIAVLAERIVTLADDPDLRRRMGEAGRHKVAESYDWPVILDRYCEFAAGLSELRRAAATIRSRPPQPYPLRPDPYTLFQSYPTATIQTSDRIVARPLDARGLDRFLDLAMVNFVIDDECLPAEHLRRLHAAAQTGDQTVGSLLQAAGDDAGVSLRALTWLLKLDILAIEG